MLSAPQSVLDTHFKTLRTLRLLFLSILILGRKASLLSKRRPTNLVSGIIFIGELYNVDWVWMESSFITQVHSYSF
jgi:hypothetical protein